MSENKETRTVVQVQSDYQNLCTRAGHVQYQLFTLEKDLSMINESLRNLNLEAASITAQEAKIAEESAQKEKSNE